MHEQDLSGKWGEVTESHHTRVPCTRSQRTRTGAHTPNRAQRCPARSEAHSPGPGPGRSSDLTPSLLPQPPQRYPPSRLVSSEARPTPCAGHGWRPCLLWSLTARAAAPGLTANRTDPGSSTPIPVAIQPLRFPSPVGLGVTLGGRQSKLNRPTTGNLPVIKKEIKKGYLSDRQCLQEGCFLVWFCSSEKLVQLMPFERFCIHKSSQFPKLTGCLPSQKFQNCILLGS